MYEIVLITIGVVVLLGLTFTLALIWVMHDIGVKHWDWSAGYKSLLDEKPKIKTKSAPPNLDIRC